jgi:uncharacterized protein YrrD
MVEGSTGSTGSGSVPTSMVEALGRAVLLRQVAESAGEVKAFVVDQPPRRVVALHVSGRVRKAHLVDWPHVVFGPDAVLVDAESSLRPADDEEAEQLGRRGDNLLGARVLDTGGFEQGTVSDVLFDAGSGALLSVVSGDRSWSAAELRALGQYALVVTAEVER